jgi:hypothetical protein
MIMKTELEILKEVRMAFNNCEGWKLLNERIYELKFETQPELVQEGKTDEEIIDAIASMSPQKQHKRLYCTREEAIEAMHEYSKQQNKIDWEKLKVEWIQWDRDGGFAATQMQVFEWFKRNLKL